MFLTSHTSACGVFVLRPTTMFNQPAVDVNFLNYPRVVDVWPVRKRKNPSLKAEDDVHDSYNDKSGTIMGPGWRGRVCWHQTKVSLRVLKAAKKIIKEKQSKKKGWGNTNAQHYEMGNVKGLFLVYWLEWMFVRIEWLRVGRRIREDC